MLENLEKIHLRLGVWGSTGAKEALRSLMAIGLALVLGPMAVGATPPRASSGARLGPFVEQLAGTYESEGEEVAVERARLRRLRVRREHGVALVPVILEPKQGLRSSDIDSARIRGLGGRVDAVSDSFVRVLVPLPRLRWLAEHPDVRVVRVPTAVQEMGLGPIESESVQCTGAAEVQQAGTTGAGIDVAVVDLGFIGLNAAISAGELPADTVIVNLPGSCDDPIEADYEHGTGVAEQVMDMSPGATLHVIKVCDEVDLENAAAYLRDAEVKIANHSAGWKIASYYDDTGPINEIINRSHDYDGVFWTVAAGNSAEGHWRGLWSDPDGDDFLNWSGQDEVNALSGQYVECVFLNWDQYGASFTDLDLGVVDRDLTIVALSEEPQTGTQTPAEVACFVYDPARAPYGVAVRRYAGPTAGLDLTIFTHYSSELQYRVEEASLMDPANAHGAYTVGAIHYDDCSLLDPPLESYSSRGPTTDGRLKPDIVSVDGTSGFTCDGPEDTLGTSFASPVAAGAAAVLLERDSSYGPEDLALALAYRAIDAGAPGPDPVFGAGVLRLEIRPDCDDGLDNDGDGFTDFVGGDPGCADADDLSENDPMPTPTPTTTTTVSTTTTTTAAPTTTTVPTTTTTTAPTTTTIPPTPLPPLVGDIPMCKSKRGRQMTVLVPESKVQRSLDKGLTRGECLNPTNGLVVCKTKRGKRMNVLVPDTKVQRSLDKGFCTLGECGTL